MSTQVHPDALLSEFVSQTCADPALAQDLLEAKNWDFAAAIRAYKIIAQQSVASRSDTSDAFNGTTTKLKRGISNTPDNLRLIEFARNQVLDEITENEVFDGLSSHQLDSSDFTFILPDLTVYKHDFRIFLERNLVEVTTQHALEQAERLNWWAVKGLGERLYPLATTGDGNCLLHAASLGMWGFHDRQLTLRKALCNALTGSPNQPRPADASSSHTTGAITSGTTNTDMRPKSPTDFSSSANALSSSVNSSSASSSSGSFSRSAYRRWRYQQRQANRQSGLMYSEAEWSDEWAHVLKLAQPTPRVHSNAPATPMATSTSDLNRPTRSDCCSVAKDAAIASKSDTSLHSVGAPAGNPTSLHAQPHIASHDSDGNSSGSSSELCYESLEEIHVFVLAHVLRRPIIIVADTMLRDANGDAFAPIPFGGIYLPLCRHPDSCYRSPMVLSYDAAHFSPLVAMESRYAGVQQQRLRGACVFNSSPITTASLIPLMDADLCLLPLQFIVDPGDLDAVGDSVFDVVFEPTVADRYELLAAYLDVTFVRLAQPSPRLISRQTDTTLLKSPADDETPRHAALAAPNDPKSPTDSEPSTIPIQSESSNVDSSHSVQCNVVCNPSAADNGANESPASNLASTHAPNQSAHSNSEHVTNERETDNGASQSESTTVCLSAHDTADSHTVPNGSVPSDYPRSETDLSKPLSKLSKHDLKMAKAAEKFEARMAKKQAKLEKEQAKAAKKDSLRTDDGRNLDRSAKSATLPSKLNATTAFVGHDDKKKRTGIARGFSALKKHFGKKLKTMSRSRFADEADAASSVRDNGGGGGAERYPSEQTNTTAEHSADDRPLSLDEAMDLLETGEHVMCARLVYRKARYQQAMIHNYMEAAERAYIEERTQRAYREQQQQQRQQQQQQQRGGSTRRKHNSSDRQVQSPASQQQTLASVARQKTPTQSSSADPTTPCINADCVGVGTALTSYLCVNCYEQQKQQALDYERCCADERIAAEAKLSPTTAAKNEPLHYKTTNQQSANTLAANQCAAPEYSANQRAAPEYSANQVRDRSHQSGDYVRVKSYANTNNYNNNNNNNNNNNTNLHNTSNNANRPVILGDSIYPASGGTNRPVSAAAGMDFDRYRENMERGLARSSALNGPDERRGRTEPDRRLIGDGERFTQHSRSSPDARLQSHQPCPSASSPRFAVRSPRYDEVPMTTRALHAGSSDHIPASNASYALPSTASDTAISNHARRRAEMENTRRNLPPSPRYSGASDGFSDHMALSYLRPNCAAPHQQRLNRFPADKLDSISDEDDVTLTGSSRALPNVPDSLLLNATDLHRQIHAGSTASTPGVGQGRRTPSRGAAAECDMNNEWLTERNRRLLPAISNYR